jgi:predicted nucleic acid-binding protein
VIVFDAGVLIAHLTTDDVFHTAADAFLDEYEEFEFVVHNLTVAECLVHATAHGRTTTVLSILERLAFVHADLTRAETVGIAEVRAATGLRMPDAIVLHTAETTGRELVTTDRALARAAEDRGVVAHLLEA